MANKPFESIPSVFDMYMNLQSTYTIFLDILKSILMKSRLIKNNWKFSFIYLNPPGFFKSIFPLELIDFDANNSNQIMYNKQIETPNALWSFVIDFLFIQLISIYTDLIGHTV